jgi:hypothetical protein
MKVSGTAAATSNESRAGFGSTLRAEIASFCAMPP